MGQKRPFARCLKPRRLFDFDRHHRQAGQEDEGAEGRPLPDVHDADRREGAGGVAEPIETVEAEQADGAVCYTEIPIEDQPSQQADDRIGCRERDDERDAGKRPHKPEAGPMQQERDAQAKRDLGRHDGTKELRCAPERLPEGRIA